jgi:pimeloyl-ACP methyl ester carboxylesterase
MSNAQTSIVLVHGSFADATGWQLVIPLLEKEGFTVTAVQNPLVSFADDVATTRRMIDAQTGPVVLVGHSYGGAVITGAAVDRPNVKALVYVAAFAPDAGENLGSLLQKYPSSIGAALRPDSAGFLYIDRAKFREVFAQDVDETTARVMAATQKPAHASTFEAKVDTAAWKTIPSWYIAATQDHAINPELQQLFAKRMKAQKTEVASSHVPFISQPELVARVIADAARAPAQGRQKPAARMEGSRS